MILTAKKKILLLCSDPEARITLDLCKLLESTNDLRAILITKHLGPSIAAGMVRGLVHSIRREHPDLVILVLYRKNPKALDEFVSIMRDALVALPTLAVVNWRDPDDLVELLRLTVEEVLIPPIDLVRFLNSARKMLGGENDRTLTKRLKEKLGLGNLIGSSPAFVSELKKIPPAARSDATVLISGETGTGKGLFARAIHYLSGRSEKAFITVNCGAIPLELVENELFGHVRGAFTGAMSSESGLVQEANDGTLFLDEIDCLSPVIQVKLLRLLQEKEYKRLGSAKIESANIRTIAAASSNLEEALEDGRFRGDLFYRLNVIRMHLPPLRDRKEDIPALALHFLRSYSYQFKKEVTNFAPKALSLLLEHDWPGNIRELENTIERSVVFCGNNVMQECDIMMPQHQKKIARRTLKEEKTCIIENFEREYIVCCLRAHRGNISKAASEAGKDRRAFWELMRRYQISAKDFRNQFIG